MSSPMNDSFETDDIIEAEHILQIFGPLGDLEEGQAFFREDIGSANAYKVDFSGSGANQNEISAYKEGQLIIFKASNANSAASTLQVAGPSGDLSAVPLTKSGNAALVAGDIQVGQMVAVVYNDAGRFEMVGAPSQGSLEGLSDVNFSSPSTGQVVQFDGSDWINADFGAAEIPSGIDAAKIGSGDVSNTEFGYLDGVTSSVQTQLDGKAPSSHNHSGSDITSGTVSPSRLGSGTPSSSTFLRGDGSWASVPGAPVGSVIPFAGSSAPSGWLLCYGQNVNRTTYADLFAALSTTFGPGDGSTTFGLPDLRGRVVAGKDNMGGTTAGRITASGNGNPGINGTTLGASGGTDRHTLTESEMPSHTHSFPLYSTNTPNTFRVQGAYQNGYLTSYTTDAKGGGQAHRNVQPTQILNYIIFAGV